MNNNIGVNGPLSSGWERTITDSVGLDHGQDAELTLSFKAVLESVNDRQQHAEQLAQAFELNDPSVDLSQVMIAMQKARVSFEALTQVRNKFVNAYQEIMNMQI